jgi:hypothetical protein
MLENTMTQIISPTSSPSYIAEKGDKIYIEKLKTELEKTNLGQYLVIEVDSEEYFINSDLLKALEVAKDKFPNKLFYIVKIGDNVQPSNNMKIKEYGWLL